MKPALGYETLHQHNNWTTHKQTCTAFMHCIVISLLAFISYQCQQCRIDQANANSKITRGKKKFTGSTLIHFTFLISISASQPNYQKSSELLSCCSINQQFARVHSTDAKQCCISLFFVINCNYYMQVFTVQFYTFMD